MNTMTADPEIHVDRKIVTLKLSPEQIRVLNINAKEIADGAVTLRILNKDDEEVGQIKAHHYSYHGGECCGNPLGPLARHDR